MPETEEPNNTEGELETSPPAGGELAPEPGAVEGELKAEDPIDALIRSTVFGANDDNDTNLTPEMRSARKYYKTAMQNGIADVRAELQAQGTVSDDDRADADRFRNMVTDRGFMEEWLRQNGWDVDAMKGSPQPSGGVTPNAVAAVESSVAMPQFDNYTDEGRKEMADYIQSQIKVGVAEGVQAEVGTAKQEIDTRIAALEQRDTNSARDDFFTKHPEVDKKIWGEMQELFRSGVVGPGATLDRVLLMAKYDRLNSVKAAATADPAAAAKANIPPATVATPSPSTTPVPGEKPRDGSLGLLGSLEEDAKGDPELTKILDALG